VRKNFPSKLFDRLLSHFCYPYLRNKHYEDFDELKSDLTVFLESQPASFYKRGIERLPARWEKVVENNGDYIVD
jgi:histone-lysine N-methyltransferase SETMAR